MPALLALMLFLSLSVSLAPRAYADTGQGSSWSISRYDMDVDLAQDGTATISLDLDFDFGFERGHGPIIALPLRQEVLDNPDLWRVLRVDLLSVTSGTGANTDVQTTTENGALLIRIGREGRTFTGVQNYRIAFRSTGLIAPNDPQSGLDEFNWNAVSTGWQVPIRQATVTVGGPAPVERAACWSGANYDVACEAQPQDDGATYAAGRLSPGRGMQVVAGFPAGTFVGAEPEFAKRPNLGNMFRVTPLLAGLTGVLSLLGVGTVIHQVRRRGRDEQYVGLTPGLSPVDGRGATVGAARTSPVAVRFSPPQDASAGELGTLIDASADNRDVTGAILHLAVRGHIHIHQVDNQLWRFTRLQSRDPVQRFEVELMNRLFRGGRSVTTEQLRNKAYAGLLTNTRSALYDQVVKERGWFQSRPDHAKAVAVVLGLLLAGAGIGLGVMLGWVAGWGLLGIAGVLTGLTLVALSGRMPARTAEGSAMLAQTKGFELYLRTAEADQIRFEEGVDIFSRYLPYAVVFGVAERWTKVFEQLAAQGRYEPDFYWYGSPHGAGLFYGAAFGHAMSGLTSAMSSAMTASVTAASAASAGPGVGGSGFSGGGGFGGVGGGGW